MEFPQTIPLFRLALWTAILAAGPLVWANPILDPSAPNTLTLYSVSNTPKLSTQFPSGYYFEGLAISGDSLLVSIGDPSVVTRQTVWSMPLLRNDGHIASVGAASLYASVPTDMAGNLPGGGLIQAPGALLYNTQAENLFGQYINSTSASLLPINPGGGATIGGMSYIPEGQTGAGQLKLSSSSSGGAWYTMNPTGSPGSYAISSLGGYAVGVPALSFAYLPADATFTSPGVAVANGQYLSLYQLDGSGNPCKTSACAPVQRLVDATQGVGIGNGMVRDPLTGDLLFTTANNEIWLLSDEIPEPSTLALALGGMPLLAGFRALFHRHRHAARTGKVADLHDHRQG
jgi:hypothetical protein